MVKNPPANAGDVGDTGSVPGSGRSPGGGNGSTLQCSCLENPMDRGAWWVQSLGSQSQTRLISLVQHSPHGSLRLKIEFSLVQLLSCVLLFATPRTAAR